MTILREIYVDLTYTRSRTKEDLLSKLGVWGSRESLEGDEGVREGSKENI